MNRRVLAATFIGFAVPATAQDAPPNLRPTRDVAVTYRTTEPSSPPTEMRMAWSVAAGKLRVDLPDGGEWMLLQADGSGVAVNDADRTVSPVRSSVGAAMTQLVPAGARYARRGAARVADTPCTDWEVVVPQGRLIACLTGDGVLLRSVAGAGQDTHRLEAILVRYDPPASLFAVPAGYREVR